MVCVRFHKTQPMRRWSFVFLNTILYPAEVMVWVRLHKAQPMRKLSFVFIYTILYPAEVWVRLPRLIRWESEALCFWTQSSTLLKSWFEIVIPKPLPLTKGTHSLTLYDNYRPGCNHKLQPFWTKMYLPSSLIPHISGFFFTTLYSNTTQQINSRSVKYIHIFHWYQFNAVEVCASHANRHRQALR